MHRSIASPRGTNAFVLCAPSAHFCISAGSCFLGCSLIALLEILGLSRLLSSSNGLQLQWCICPTFSCVGVLKEHRLHSTVSLRSSRRDVHPEAVARVDGRASVGAHVFRLGRWSVGGKLEVVLLQEHGQRHGGFEHRKLVAHAPERAHGLAHKKKQRARP